jgi:transcriptional regulator with XRE-family HTH domain
VIGRTPQTVIPDREFTQNIRYLCSYYKSMSEVCRRVGINRQQFNKYAAGISRPSNRNMRRLCEFFGVEEFEILSPHSELRKIVEVRGIKTTGDGDTYLTRILKRGIEQSDPAIRKYYGTYFTYYHSFSLPGKILKAILHLSERDGIAGYKRIERLVDRERPSGASFVFKYEGVALYLRERIFLIDREALTGNEISHSILYPSYKNKVSLLTGLTLGTAGLTSREPICSRILLEYLGPGANIKESLGQCGLYRPDSRELDPAIVRAIENIIPPDSSALRALPS